MITRRATASAALAICLIITTVILHALPAKADFNQNNIIDDWLFDNAGTMTAAQIDQFLNRFPNSCISPNHGFKAPDPTGTSPSISGFYYGGDVTAGQVIYDSAQAYGLNPQVILATLQKEESLVDGSSGCSTLRYVAAMGDACPDNITSHDYSGFELYSINGNPVTSVQGTCVNNSDEVGFSRQVITATWKLKFWEERSEGNVSWAPVRPGWDNSNLPSMYYSYDMTQGYFSRRSGDPVTYFDGYKTVDNTAVHLDNGATAALYIYTPHFHGNQMFVSIFEQWFGLATGEGYVLATSYDDNGDPRQWVVYHGMRRLVPDTATLQAWGLDKVPLIQWPGTLLGSYPTQDLKNDNAYPLSRLMRPSGTLDVYFIDGGNCFRLVSQAMMDAWGFNTASIDDVSIGLGQVPHNQGNLSYAIKDATDTSGSVYMVDGGITRKYGTSNVLAAWEGDGTNPATISHAYFSSMSTGSTISNSKVTDGSNEYQVVAGQKLLESGSLSQLYPGDATIVSPKTLARLWTGSPASQFVRGPNSQTIYLVDGGNKHAIGTPGLLRAWGVAWGGGPLPLINTVTQGNINLLTTGTALNSYEADVGGQLYLMDGRKIVIPSALDATYRTPGNIYSPSSAMMNLLPNGGTISGFVKSFNSPAVYLVDTGTLRQVRTPNELGLLSPSGAVTSVSDYVLSQFSSGATIGAYLTDGTNNYLIESGVKHPIDTSTQTNWRISNPDVLSTTALGEFATASPINSSFQNSGQYFFIQKGVAYGTVDSNIADEWSLKAAPTLSLNLIQEFLSSAMLTRFALSSSDNSMYIVDQGILYRLTPDQAVNLGATSNMPIMVIDPNAITASAGTNLWTSVVVHDASGTQYVIDNGGKRTFPSNDVLNYWLSTGAGNITTQLVSNGFLNLLPTKGNVDRAIKGSAPNVYAIYTQSNIIAKHWIQNPTTFNTQFGRYETVSDTLLKLISSGSNL